MKTIFILLSLQGFFVFRETSAEDIDMNSIRIHQCKANDPNLNDCMKEALQILIPQASNGVSELNIPPMDPLKTPEMTFKQTTGDNNLIVTYKDIVQTGFSEIHIESADIDLQHGVMNFKLKYPHITFTADYVASGQFLGFEVNGNGKANISVWNAYSSLVLKFHVVSNHIKQHSVIIGFSFDKIFLDYTNLKINDDKDLSESASKFINDNSFEIIEGFKPELEKFYAKITGDFLQTVFDAVPYNVLFPKD